MSFNLCYSHDTNLPISSWHYCCHIAVFLDPRSEKCVTKIICDIWPRMCCVCWVGQVNTQARLRNWWCPGASVRFVISGKILKLVRLKQHQMQSFLFFLNIFLLWLLKWCTIWPDFMYHHVIDVEQSIGKYWRLSLAQGKAENRDK